MPDDSDVHAMLAISHHDTWWAKGQQWSATGWTMGLLGAIPAVSQPLGAKPGFGLSALACLVFEGALAAFYTWYLCSLHWNVICARANTDHLRSVRPTLDALIKDLPTFDPTEDSGRTRGIDFAYAFAIAVSVTLAFTLFATTRSLLLSILVAVAQAIASFVGLGATAKRPLPNKRLKLASEDK